MQRLRVLRYCGLEYATQQRADATCQEFIRLAFPGRGDHDAPNSNPGADPAELDALLDESERYRVICLPGAGHHALLIYDNEQVYVPARGRRALIQAAHSATHQGMGPTAQLLRREFYWPTLEEDADHLTAACRTVRGRRRRRDRRARPSPTSKEPLTAEEDPKPEQPIPPANSSRASGAYRKRLEALNRLAHRIPDSEATHVSYCPQHRPEPAGEAAPTGVERATRLLTIARQMEETIRKIKGCQLITEGDVARQTEEWHPDACQSQELPESVLSWQARDLK